MRKIGRLILFLLLISMLLMTISCIRPPEGVDEINVIHLLDELLMQFAEESKNGSEKIDIWSNIRKRTNTIFNFYRDSHITVTTSPAAPAEDVFLYSIGKNQLKVAKPLYITYINDEFCYSFDNETWYSTTNSKEAGIRGLRNYFHFDNTIQDNHININIDFYCKKGDNPLIEKKPAKREVIKLEKGMTFNSKVQITRVTDLTKKILFIPENTLLTGVLSIKGNVVTGETVDGKIQVNSLRDIYAYTRHKLFSVSFNKKNWNVNLLGFVLDPDLTITAVDDHHILFNYDIFLDYEQDRVSLSIVKQFL